jgi:HSP20 family protein
MDQDEEMMDEWERALRQRFGWARGWSRQRTQAQEWTPVMDMFDKGDRLLLRAELPGVSQDQIDVFLNQGILTIQGERKPEAGESGDEWLCCERPYGKFYRAVQLPSAVDADAISAEYRDGVLTVTLPKRTRTQPQKISVRAEQ